MRQRRVTGLAGRSLVGFTAIAMVVLLVGALVGGGLGEAGVRAAIRASARSSLALFLLVFAAAPVNALWPSRASKWLQRNRRYLGVSFAVSQLGHLAVIVALAVGWPASFSARLSAVTLYGGGLGFVLTALLAATSFDGAVAWLGRARWRLLHRVGSYYIWFVFALTYLGRAAFQPAYAPLAVAVVVPLCLRCTVACLRWWRARAPLTAAR